LTRLVALYEVVKRQALPLGFFHVSRDSRQRCLVCLLALLRADHRHISSSV